MFYAESNDGGLTFSTPMRVTEVTTDWQATPSNIAPNFGDYIFHVSTPNHVMATWADGRSGVMPEVYYASIGVGKMAKEIALASATSQLPSTVTLNQNYPNPFNPATEISFVLPEESDVSLKIYNLNGEQVAVLAEGWRAAGQHHVSFNAQGLSSGVYLYQLISGNHVSVRKMILLK